MAPGSWCRAKTITTNLDIEIKDGPDDRTSKLGTPFRPTSILFGGGSCEFQFEDVASDKQFKYGLAVEAPIKGRDVKGTAKCKETGGDGDGFSVELMATATHWPNVTKPRDLQGTDVHTDPPDQELSTVLNACRKSNGEALWLLMTPRFRAEVDARAAKIARTLSAGDLKRVYGYAGKPQAFTGLILLRHSLRLGESSDNPCAGIAGWKVTKQGPMKDVYVVAVERSAEYQFGLLFLRTGRGWLLDQITQAVPKR